MRSGWRTWGARSEADGEATGWVVMVCVATGSEAGAADGAPVWWARRMMARMSTMRKKAAV